MRFLTIVLFFIPFFSNAQVCDSIETTTDKFTDLTETGFKSPYIIEAKEFENSVLITASFHHSGKKKYLYFASPALNCIDGNSSVNIVFTDNTKLRLINDAEFNCKGAMLIDMKFTPLEGQSQWSILEKKISAIRLIGMSTTVDIDVPDEDASIILEMMRCWSDVFPKKK
jgi:hypothetical protein